MTHTAVWPSINAMLNATSACLLIAGMAMIRSKRKALHAVAMMAAMAVSAMFFLSYLAYHAHVGSVRFQGDGWARPVYFSILVSHTVLAVVIVPMAIRTAWLAARQRWTAHVGLARWTFPLWLYVAISGVVVYWMLYHVTA